MATISIDPHQAISQLTSSGFSRDQAKALVDVIGDSEFHGIATKENIHELQLEIARLRADLFRWAVPLLVGQMALFAGINAWLFSAIR